MSFAGVAQEVKDTAILAAQGCDGPTRGQPGLRRRIRQLTFSGRTHAHGWLPVSSGVVRLTTGACSVVFTVHRLSAMGRRDGGPTAPERRGAFRTVSHRKRGGAKYAPGISLSSAERRVSTSNSA
jgi:hypothetical protein